MSVDYLSWAETGICGLLWKTNVVMREVVQNWIGTRWRDKLSRRVARNVLVHLLQELLAVVCSSSEVYFLCCSKLRSTIRLLVVQLILNCLLFSFNRFLIELDLLLTWLLHHFSSFLHNIFPLYLFYPFHMFDFSYRWSLFWIIMLQLGKHLLHLRT